MSQSPNCWYCDRATMVEVPGQVYPYSKCTACGATKCPLPKVSAPAYTERDGEQPGERIRTPHRQRQKKASCTPETEPKGGSHP